jgi:hypothetical protein
VLAVVVVERGGAPVARWSLRGVDAGVHLGHVDALARLALQAGRRGCTLRLERADPALVELLDLAGLRGGQVLRETERGEEPAVHLEERVEADDPLG